MSFVAQNPQHEMQNQQHLNQSRIPTQSELPREQQLAMWQQDSYMQLGETNHDSGIMSAATMSVAGNIEDELLFDWDQSSGVGTDYGSNIGISHPTQDVDLNSQSQLPSDIFPESMDEGMDIPNSPFVPSPAMQKIQGASATLKQTASSLSSREDSSLATMAIPDLIKLLNDEDHYVVGQAADTVHQLSKRDTSCYAILSSPQMISAVIKAMTTSNDMETTRSAAGALHNISQHRNGLSAIFESGGIPALIRLLSSPIESVLFYAITTLHNLLLHQEGSKMAVRLAGGLQKMVSLLQRNNVKFLAIVADCLQILAYGNQESKLIILASGGPSELVRILRTYNYEKLLWTCTRVLKVLSVCFSNKPAIIEAGGVQALAQHLQSSSERLVLNCLWTLRNLSDAATRQDGLEELLLNLVSLLSTQNANLVTCVVGILANLTCNNQKNKSIVSRVGGVEALVLTVISAGNNEDIIEPAVCALRHLTCRHPGAEQAQEVVRGHYGFQSFIKLLQPPSKWPLIKAVMGLLKNFAIHPLNIPPLRDNGAIHSLLQILHKAGDDIATAQMSGNTKLRVDGVDMTEIVEISVGALHLLSKQPESVQLMVSLNAIPMFAQLLYYENEEIQRTAAGVLCELSYDQKARDRIY